MKERFTLKSILTVITALLFVVNINAQQKTVNVPGDYTNVNKALIAIKKGNLVDFDDITIMVAEGDIKEGSKFGPVRRKIKITIAGAGAGKTFITGYGDFEPMPAPGEDGKHFFSNAGDENEGSEFIFKDLTFKRWGLGTEIGGAVLNTMGKDQKASFINCHFIEIQAEKGAIIHAGPANTVIFDNCFISRCTSIDRNGMNGLINLSNGGTLKISNTTFMSNLRNPVTLGDLANEEGEKRKAGVISLGNSEGSTLNFEMTNCVFVNNQTVAEASNVIQPMISFFPLEGTIVAKMEKNMMIGNLRAGKENDVDIYIDNMDKITWTNSNNVLNKALKRVDTEGVVSFLPAEIPGSSINTEYTYTHANILFEMEGNLPKILVDDQGVNYVSYSGVVGLKNFNKESIGIYPNPSRDAFNILVPQNLSNAYYEVYTSLGKLVKKGRFNSNNLTIDLSDSNKGLYILRIDDNGRYLSRKLMLN